MPILRSLAFLHFALTLVSTFTALLLLNPRTALSEESVNNFKLGVSLPLAGPYQEYGIAVQHGIEFAQLDRPELFKTLTFIYEDNAYDQKGTLAGLRKMLDQDEIKFAFAWGNEPALAAAPILEQKRIPSILLSQHPAVGRNRHYVIRSLPDGEYLSKGILSYLRTQGVHEAAILKTEISFFNLLIEGIDKYKGNAAFEVTQTFLPSDLDFRAAITKLKSQNVKTIGVYLIAPQIREFFRQSFEQNFTPIAFGATPFESSSIFKELLPKLEGLVYSHHHAEDSFEQRYFAKYQNNMHIGYAANAYDMAIIAARAITEASGEKASGNAILEKLRSTPTAQGMAGRYKFIDTPESGQYFDAPIAVKRITNGRPVVVWRSADR
jgi:ABC-type branched-subunit amino acid transport system substrate-binding protein